MTIFHFERNAMMSAAHLTADDGGTAFVFCSIPGGKPQFQFSPKDRVATTVLNAPTCNTHQEFERFVKERFA